MTALAITITPKGARRYLAQRGTDRVLLAMYRLERALKRRNLYAGSGIHHPRVGDFFVEYHSHVRNLERYCVRKIRVGEDGSLRRAS